MDSLRRDLTVACRRLRKAPVFTGTALLTLGLAIGANTALFSIVNGLLLKPIPGVSVDRVFNIALTLDGRASIDHSLNAGRFQRLREMRLRSLKNLTTVSFTRGVVSARHDSGVLGVEMVTGGYFDLLGVRPRVGRLLMPVDDRPDSDVVVISERLWRRWFGATSSAMGQPLRWSGRLLTVVGVAPEPFRGLSVPGLFGVDLWVPSASAEATSGPHGRVFARLEEGFSSAQARSEVRVAGASIDVESPDVGLELLDADTAIMPRPMTAYLILAGSAIVALSALLLVIGCANVSNLLLARVSSQSSEIAIRLSMGASRQRIVQLVAAETTVLALLGGLIGAALTIVTPRLVSQLPMPEIAGLTPQWDATPDWRVFAYGFLATIAVASGLAFVPAVRASRTDPMPLLTSGGGTGTPSRRSVRTRAILLGSQMACSTILVILAVLFVRSTVVAMSYKPDFASSGTVVGHVDYALQGYDETQGRQRNRLILQTAETLTSGGIAALSTGLPRTRGGEYVRVARVGDPGSSRRAEVGCQMLAVSPGFFDVLRLDVRGRRFTDRDMEGSELVAVINDSAARTLWPGQNAIGRQFRVRAGNWETDVRVIGITSDTEKSDPDPAERRFIFVPLAQRYGSRLVVVARTSGPATAAAQLLKPAVHAALPDVVLYDVRTLDEELELVGGGVRVRTTAVLLSLLGAAGLVIALVGLSGVAAYAASQRAREFGIMKALGATNLDVYRALASDTLVVVPFGLGAGVLMALVVSLTLRRFLVGVTPYDPLTFTVVPACLILASVVAAFVPARRTARSEPHVTLRAL